MSFTNILLSQIPEALMNEAIYSPAAEGMLLCIVIARPFNGERSSAQMA